MSENRERILIRFQPKISDCLEAQAALEGVKIGTVANRILQEELEKVSKVGISNCMVLDSDDYAKILPEIEQGRGVYLLPEVDMIQQYLPSRRDRTINRQISLYISQQQQELLLQIVKIQDIMGTIEYGKVVSYRYAIHGLFLNSPIIQKWIS